MPSRSVALFRRSTRRAAAAFARVADRPRDKAPDSAPDRSQHNASAGYDTFYETAAAQSVIDYAAQRFAEPELSYFRTHAGRFAFLCEVIHRLPVRGRALDAGGLPETRELFETRTGLTSVELSPDVDLEMELWADAAGVGRYELVIFSEVIEHFNADPARALHEINRCLSPGGYLVLTTVNIGSELGLYNLARGQAPYAMSNLYGERTDRHQREYAPTELQLLVAAHGFETWATTVNVYSDAAVKREARAWCASRGLDARMHGDPNLVVARKVDESSGPRWLHPVYHSSVAVNRANTVPPDVAERLRDGAPPGLQAFFPPA